MRTVFELTKSCTPSPTPVTRPAAPVTTIGATDAIIFDAHGLVQVSSFNSMGQDGADVIVAVVYASSPTSLAIPHMRYISEISLSNDASQFTLTDTQGKFRVVNSLSCSSLTCTIPPVSSDGSITIFRGRDETLYGSLVAWMDESANHGVLAELYGHPEGPLMWLYDRGAITIGVAAQMIVTQPSQAMARVYIVHDPESDALTSFVLPVYDPFNCVLFDYVGMDDARPALYPVLLPNNTGDMAGATATQVWNENGCVVRLTCSPHVDDRRFGMGIINLQEFVD